MVVVVVLVHLKGKRIHEAEQLSRSHLDKKTIMEPFWGQKKQLMNHFEEKDNFVTILRGKKQSLINFEAEKMQLAIIEQFQKKNHYCTILRKKRQLWNHFQENS